MISETSTDAEILIEIVRYVLATLLPLLILYCGLVLLGVIPWPQ